jgi:regulator of protease activity HflC (stomatin/prohibitin superfamily)
MSTYGGGFSRDKVIDVGGGTALRLAGLAFLAFFLVIIFFMSIAKIDTGHVGVLTYFGRVTGEVLGEGIHLVNPLKRVHEMSVRTQELKETASVPSNEGLVMNLDTSLIYKLDRTKANEVYQQLGPEYAAVIIEPNLRSAIRSVTAAHSANALYSSAREKVAQEIRAELERELGPRGITVENVLLRDIQLPATLKASIETKQQAEQESLAMGFRLQKERQEADRKRIEAEGIRDFQRTVSAGISPELLTWKGIEATEKLADSKNTKIVVIGNTKNGLPIIMGQ